MCFLGDLFTRPDATYCVHLYSDAFRISEFQPREQWSNRCKRGDRNWWDVRTRKRIPPFYMRSLFFVISNHIDKLFLAPGGEALVAPNSPT